MIRVEKKLEALPDGFTEKDLKRCRKLLKKAGVPKEMWFIDLLDTETKNVIRFKL
jgi:hypothetical protein